MGCSCIVRGINVTLNRLEINASTKENEENQVTRKLITQFIKMRTEKYDRIETSEGAN